MSDLETASIDAVALLRIPNWEPPEELDVRELEDGLLVFLSIPFDTEPEELWDELESEVGPSLYDHEDDRGVLFLPDSSEPEDAETYDAVIAAVGEAGKWIAIEEQAPDLASLLGGNAEGLIGQVFEAMGIQDPQGLLQAMQSGDPEKLKLAQIQMQGKLEEAMRGMQSGALGEGEGEDEDEDDAKSIPPAVKPVEKPKP